MSECRTIDVTVDGRVGQLELNRPSKLNAISVAMVEELTAAVQWLDARPDVRCVVLSGRGRLFSAGADVDEFAASFADGTLNTEVAEAEARLGGALTDAVESMDAVTIAAVHGAAIGGAAALVTACDLRIMAHGAQIVVPELAMGVPLAWGGIERLVRDLGPAVARDLLLTARPLGASEAVARGYASEEVELERLQARAREVADLVASRPAHGVRVALQRIRAATDHSTVDGMDDDAAALAAALKDPDAIRAGRAYLASLSDRPSD
jgi:enoyl-CoA hydratase/carnithine racemase